MKQLGYISFAATIALATIPAFAQQEAVPTPTPVNAADMPTDCRKVPMKRHTHADAQGFGISGASKAAGAPCGPGGAPSATGATVKKTSAHNHAKFHKNQP
jgi:hypothetical protein